MVYGSLRLILFGILWACWIWMSVSFTSLGVFSTIISSNKSFVLFSLLLMEPSLCLMLSQRSLKLSSFNFFLIFIFCHSNWVISTTVSFRSLIQSSASSHLLLITSSAFVISVTVFLSSFDWLFFIFFCFFVDVLTPFMHSFPEFSKQLYVNYLELFI